MKRVLLTLCALCATGVLWAATATVNGITWTYSVSNGEATIGAGLWSPAIPQSTSGAITIPSSLGGYPVTSIGISAFYGCSGLTSVTIPSSVTSIGSQAFFDCSGLTSITIPSSVTEIGEMAFELCFGLTSITIPEGVTSIGGWAFYACQNLTSLSIPTSVKTLGDTICHYCAFVKITVDPQNPSYASRDGALLTKDGKTLLHGPGATESYTVPEGVTAIGISAFSGRTNLVNLTLSEGVTSIGATAFMGCFALTSVELPSTLTSIDHLAFMECSALKAVTFNGPPPSGDSPSFPEADGTYLPEYASEWQAVLDVDGKWNNLTMQCLTQAFEVVLTAVGEGTVAGGGEHAAGDEVTVTATPEDGWTFCGWNTEPVVMDPEYTFTMPVKDVALTAYFAPETAVNQHISGNGLLTPAEAEKQREEYILEHGFKTESEVAEAIEQHIAKNNLMSREEAKQALLDADEVFTADEMKAMAFDAPVLEVGAENIEVSISLQTADSLDSWQAMALEGATLEVDPAVGMVRVIVPKGEKKAAFYKFVVPPEQSK